MCSVLNIYNIVTLFSKFEPRDLCTDKWGFVFIADNFRRRVHVLDSSGHFIRYIASFPRAVDVDNVGNVWIGAWCRVTMIKYRDAVHEQNAQRNLTSAKYTN